MERFIFCLFSPQKPRLPVRRRELFSTDIIGQKDSDNFPVVFIQIDKFKVVIAIAKISFVCITEVSAKGFSDERFAKVRVDVIPCAVRYDYGLCYFGMLWIKGDIFEIPRIFKLNRQFFF